MMIYQKTKYNYYYKVVYIWCILLIIGNISVFFCQGELPIRSLFYALVPLGTLLTIPPLRDAYLMLDSETVVLAYDKHPSKNRKYTLTDVDMITLAHPLMRSLKVSFTKNEKRTIDTYHNLSLGRDGVTRFVTDIRALGIKVKFNDNFKARYKL